MPSSQQPTNNSLCLYSLPRHLQQLLSNCICRFISGMSFFNVILIIFINGPAFFVLIYYSNIFMNIIAHQIPSSSSSSSSSSLLLSSSLSSLSSSSLLLSSSSSSSYSSSSLSLLSSSSSSLCSFLSMVLSYHGRVVTQNISGIRLLVLFPLVQSSSTLVRYYFSSFSFLQLFHIISYCCFYCIRPISTPVYFLRFETNIGFARSFFIPNLIQDCIYCNHHWKLGQDYCLWQ